MRAFDLSATCTGLHRAPRDGDVIEGLAFEWFAARPTHDRTAALVYAFATTREDESEEEVALSFGAALHALGAGNIHVRRARQAWDVEAKAATLVAEMMRGVR